MAADPSHVRALHRYFVWANRIRMHALSVPPPPDDRFDLEAWSLAPSTYVGYWLSALFVVAEGWRELGLQDAEVDALLSEADLVDILRRFRNGMFHFQREYSDPRFVAFFQNSDRLMPWASKLHSAFSRHFLAFIQQEFGGLEIERDADGRVTEFSVKDPFGGGVRTFRIGEPKRPSFMQRLIAAAHAFRSPG